MTTHWAELPYALLAKTSNRIINEVRGIKLEDMIKIFNVSNARSYASEVRFPKHILSGKWDARSRVYNLRKDLTMAVDMAGALDTKVPLGVVTRDFLNVAMDQGMTDTDYSRLYERFDEIVAGVGKKKAVKADRPGNAAY